MSLRFLVRTIALLTLPVAGIDAAACSSGHASDAREPLERAVSASSALPGDGGVLDIGGPMPPTTQRAGQARVAYGAGEYLAIWQRADTSLWATRVSADPAATATSLDPVGIRVTGPVGGGSPGANPLVAFDGTNFRAFWADADGNVSTVSISPQGELTGAPMQVAVGGSYDWQNAGFAAACAQTGTCFVLSEASQLMLTRIDATGAALAAPVALDPVSARVGITVAGTEAYAFWLGGSPLALRGARMDVTGVQSAAATIAPLPANVQGLQVDHQMPVVATAKEVLVAWDLTLSEGAADPQDNIMMAEVDLTGKVLGYSWQALVGANDPALTSVGTGFVLSASWVGFGQAVFAVDAGGGVGSLQATSVGTYQQGIASDGTYALVVGAPDLTLADRLDAALVDATGHIARPLVPVMDSWRQQPSAAPLGSDFLVAWTQAAAGSTVTAVSGARVNASNGVVASFPIATAASGQVGVEAPAMASNGTAVLAVWETLEDSAHRRMDAALLTGTPAQAPAAFPLVPDTALASQAAVASNGDAFLVAWVGSDGATSSVYAARVDATGTILDPRPITLEASASPIYDDVLQPALAYDGTRYVAAWLAPNSVGAYDVHGATVGVDGTLTPLAPLVTGEYLEAMSLGCAPGQCLLASGSSWDVSAMELRPVASPDGGGAAFSLGDTAGTDGLQLAWNGTSLVLATSSIGVQWLTAAGTPIAPAFENVASVFTFDASHGFSAAVNDQGETLLVAERTSDSQCVGAFVGAPPPPPAEAGAEGGTIDAASADGASEGGPVTITDGGDAGDEDGGDAASPDAASGQDAGHEDAGDHDAAPPLDSGADSGAPADASPAPDASGSDDAGADSGAPPEGDASPEAAADAGSGAASNGGGCGCAVAGADGTPWTGGAALVLGAAATARRKRRGSKAGRR